MSSPNTDALRTLHSQAVSNNVKRDAAIAVASVSTLTTDEVADLLVALGLDEKVECLKCGVAQYVWHLCQTCEGCRDCCAESGAA